MKVLILGASDAESTGFIGKPVADAFVRAGHIVYGQTRSQNTAIELAKDEIIPVICDPLSSDGSKVWAKVASESDVGSGAQNAISTFQTFLNAVSLRPKYAPKATYIYTSGLWYMSRGYGGLDVWTDERQPPSDYNQAVQWRGEIEEAVLSEKSINGIVIRPPIMYGRSQSFVSYYILDAAYEAAKNGTAFETFVEPETRWLTAHQDDVGDLFLRAGERGPLAAGQAFLAANLQSERLTDILDAVVRVSGAKGYTAKKAESPYDKAWVSTLLARPSLAAALLGWTPKKMSLVDGMDVYWESYLASKGRLGGKL